jgi:hypothetical protein
MGEVTARLSRWRLALAMVSCLGTSLAFAANGSWKFATEDQGHPELSYSENNKSIFWVGCGHAFVMRAVYPGAPGKDGEKAAITIANGKTQVNFEGTFESGLGDRFPPGTTYFFQSDLGYDHLDDNVYGKTWRKKEARLFDFLDSGRPLTVSAESRSYVLPPIKIRSWKSRFKKIC